MTASMKRKTGEIAAALVSLWLGLASLVAGHLWSVANPLEANRTLLKIGSWMPNWQGIGPFAGKQTVALATWLISWLLLFFILKQKEVNLKVCCCLFLVGFAVLVILTWPPVYHAIFGWQPAVPH